jgi:hypothetical protein
MKSTIFWDVTPCRAVEYHRLSGEASSKSKSKPAINKGQAKQSSEMEAKYSPEISMKFYQTARPYISNNFKTFLIHNNDFH